MNVTPKHLNFFKDPNQTYSKPKSSNFHQRQVVVKGLKAGRVLSGPLGAKKYEVT
jgi:hypothetical protein